MDNTLYFAFILTSAIFILIPGPNVLVVVATSLQSGRRRGLQTVIGTSLAMAIQLLLAALATSGVLLILNMGLLWLKWLGVAYLAWLGLRAFYRCWQPEIQSQASAQGSMRRGFWVSLTNPKTILFFSAFLPQFVSPAGNYIAQLAILSVTFWCLGVVLDSCYAILADKLRFLLPERSSSRTVNGISGSVYLTASALLASSNRA